MALAEPTSNLGESGLIDVSRIDLAKQTVSNSLHTISATVLSEEEIKTFTSKFAKSVSYITAACKAVSEKTKNPISQKQYIQFTKELAAFSTNVVSSIKALAASQSDSARAAVSKSSVPVLDVVQKILTYSSSSEFSHEPPFISVQALDVIEPILQQGRQLVDASCGMLSTSRDILLRPTDTTLWQRLGHFSKQVGESAKAVVGTLKERTPGRFACEKALLLMDSLQGEVESASELAKEYKTLARTETMHRTVGEQLIPAINRLSLYIQQASDEAQRDGVHLAHSIHVIASQTRWDISALSHTLARITYVRFQSYYSEYHQLLLQVQSQVQLTDPGQALAAQSQRVRGGLQGGRRQCST